MKFKHSYLHILYNQILTSNLLQGLSKNADQSPNKRHIKNAKAVMNEWIYQSKQNKNLGHGPAKKWKSF